MRLMGSPNGFIQIKRPAPRASVEVGPRGPKSMVEPGERVGDQGAALDAGFPSASGLPDRQPVPSGTISLNEKKHRWQAAIDRLMRPTISDFTGRL